jgi:hypothetical protein
MKDWSRTIADLGRISLAAVLDREFVGRSLMVEGGTSVISALLSSRLVDLVVITIAPVLIGDGISMIQGVVRRSPYLFLSIWCSSLIKNFADRSSKAGARREQDIWKRRRGGV